MTFLNIHKLHVVYLIYVKFTKQTIYLLIHLCDRPCAAEKNKKFDINCYQSSKWRVSLPAGATICAFSILHDNS